MYGSVGNDSYFIVTCERIGGRFVTYFVIVGVDVLRCACHFHSHDFRFGKIGRPWNCLIKRPSEGEYVAVEIFFVCKTTSC
jgi:hypothetical protein